jgi:hypothetical protein
MSDFTSPGEPQTRFVFRVLAGVIAVFIFLVAVPTALYEAISGDWYAWFLALGSLIGGIGLAVGARTGRWFNSLG